MLNTLLGEGQYAIKLLFAFIIIFGVLALALWLLRRFGGERLGNAGARGRQPRLAVIDQANVDSRRRLILVRRDNVEHLLMIGGPSDVVVEPNIVRGAAAAREPVVARPAPAGDTLPKAVPLGEDNMWPLQPEPAPRLEPLPRAEPRAEPRPEPRPRLEGVVRPEPPPRGHRPPPPAPAEETSQHWAAPEPERPPPAPPPAPAPRERITNDDPLSGLAEELARESSTTDREPAPQPRRQAPRRDLRSRPAPVPSGGTPSTRLTPPADHNLAEMAQRLEAALRRPAKGNEVRPAPPSPAPKHDPKHDLGSEEVDEAEPAPTSTGITRAAQPADLPRNDAPGHDAPRHDVLKSARNEPRNEPRPAPRSDVNAAPQRSLYDSLEQEMASLLGRPDNRSEE